MQMAYQLAVSRFLANDRRVGWLLHKQPVAAIYGIGSDLFSTPHVVVSTAYLVLAQSDTRVLPWIVLQALRGVRRIGWNRADTFFSSCLCGRHERLAFSVKMAPSLYFGSWYLHRTAYRGHRGHCVASRRIGHGQSDKPQRRLVGQSIDYSVQRESADAI